jgi:hypothetical protein
MRIRDLWLIVILSLTALPSPTGAVPSIRDRIAPYPAYVLTLELRDETGAPIDARVSVLDPISGHCYGPVETAEPVYEWAVSILQPDRVEVVVPRRGPPAGRERAESPFTMRSSTSHDRTYTVQIRLDDTNEYGWFSGTQCTRHGE